MYKELILELTQNNEYVKIQSPCTEKKLRKQKRQSATPFRKSYGNFFMNWTGTNIFSCLQRRYSRKPY